jgi:hypothetical protein
MLHRRVVGKLRAGQSQSQKKSIGIVVDGEEYIKNTISRMMLQNRFANMQPANAMVDIEVPKNQDPSVRDIGTFELKRAEGGELAYQREPIYSALPSTQEAEVNETNMVRAGKRPIYRMQGAITKRRDLVHTAKRQLKANPFQKTQPNIQFNYIY